MYYLLEVIQDQPQQDSSENNFLVVVNLNSYIGFNQNKNSIDYLFYLINTTITKLLDTKPHSKHKREIKPVA